ncbi:hypothetical protein RT717_07150 [Imperialibacter roseus]|uniref:Uncharacterized protein n=1 Tax=Imperialibacter roseus TaxID=1324217 RepID=A0ABZ0ITQ8_9BACT|nr:hypothetical protein [Imperialibacter roseus]WOK08413.1 hypothetical protein RT717_07150 [Imperialibacter roseus]
MKHTNYDKNVFINCPFDDKYFDLLRTLIFTIVYFGFNPRISLESSDSGLSRLEKIIKLIQESKYAVHDLSRLQAKSIDEYYRLNMPFELGIDYGLRRFNPDFSDRRSVILETERYDYMKAISDINGFDIKSHDDIPEKLIECLRSWFSETVGLRDLNSSDKIYSDFIDFNTDLYMKKMMKYAGKHTATEAERFVDTEIQQMTLPEFIDEIKLWKDGGT